MSELKKNVLLSCCVTTFHTPNSFWLIFDNDITARDNYCESLNSPGIKYSPLSVVSEGELVIFTYEKQWVRGQVAQIINDESIKEYLCWQLDFGIFTRTTRVYKLPDEHKITPPFVRKAILYGLLSYRKDDDKIVTIWAPGITRYSNQLIKTQSTNHKFCINFVSDDFLIGDLYLFNSEKFINIREKIISTGLAAFNEDYFLENLNALKRKQESLAIIYLQTKFFSESDACLASVRDVRCNGRGTFRSLTSFHKESTKTHKKLKEMPSETFSDAESDVTQNKRKQCVKNSTKNSESVEIYEIGEKLVTKRRNESSTSKENKTESSTPSPQPVEISGRGKILEKMMAKRQTEINEPSASKDNYTESSTPSPQPVEISGRGKILEKMMAKRQTEINELNASKENHTESSTLSPQPNECSGRSKKLQNLIAKRQNTISPKEDEKTNNHIRRCGNFNIDFEASELEDSEKFEDAENTPSTSKQGDYLNKTSLEYNTTRSSNKSSISGTSSSKSSSSDTNELKSSNKLVENFGRGRPKSSESDSDKSFSTKMSSQEGSFDSDSDSDMIENFNKPSTSSQRRFVKELGSVKSVKSFESDSKSSNASENGRNSMRKSFKDLNFSCNDDSFEDAIETASNSTTTSSKKSIFRDSPSVEFVTNGTPAGALLNSAKNSGHGDIFPEIANQKRPPIGNNATEVLKKFKNNFKNEKSAISEKPKRIAGLCECNDCTGWRNNEKVFEPYKVEIRKKPERPKFSLKPPLLFKTAAKEESTYKIVTKRTFDSNTSKLAAPRVLLHSVLQAGSSIDLPHTPFDPSIQSALRNLNYNVANSIQTYSWPAVLRGLNVIVVSVPSCGKTMVYVPAICTSNFHNNPDLPKSIGPTSIILCPKVEIAQNIHRLFCSILSKSKTNIKPVVACYYSEKKHERSLRDADILITTPRILKRILKETSISLNRLCHVVLEEAHELLPLFSAEIEYIFKETQKVLINRTDCIQIQLIIISQQWNKQIEKIAKNLKLPPTICIGAHLEAALYGKTDINVILKATKDKPSKTIQIIKDDFQYSKTVILCDDAEHPKDLLAYFEAHGIHYETLFFESTIEDINAANERWANSHRGAYFVLVCSDNIFNTGLAITDAEIIVQYTLPENWSQFTFRFSGFIDSYSSPLITKTEDMKTCKMHILVDENNTKQFPKVIQFLKRMGKKLPPSLLKFHEELIDELEQTKLQKKINICNNLLLFASCKNTITCEYRHIFRPDIDVQSHTDIPKSGLIKCKILNFDSPMQFYARILEHTDSEALKHPSSDYYALIATHLLTIDEQNDRLSTKHIKEGKICASRETKGATKTILRRAKILQVIKNGFNIKEVIVDFIDMGYIGTAAHCQIYRLPKELKKIPPQGVSVYLSNVGPPDFDTSWSSKALVSLIKTLKDLEYSNASCYFTGRIKLQLGNALFVDDLKLYELLDNDFLLQKGSIRQILLRQKFLEKRPNHLKSLYDLCKNYEIPLHDYSLPVIKDLVKVEPQAKPDWAHLENSEEFNSVFFSMAHNPDSFFVKLSKNSDCLANLQKNIKTTMHKPFYRKVVTPVEGHCYLVFDHDEQTYNRAIVRKIEDNIAHCFFVDFGDTTDVTLDELKYLPDDLIKQLPFQVIECKLHGIKPSKKDGKWLDEATDILYSIAYEPDTNFFRFLHVKVIGEEKPQYTDYKKYSVILLDTLEKDVIVNNLFLDLGYAIPTTEETIEADFEKLRNKFSTQIEENELNLETVTANEELDFEMDEDRWDCQINNPEEFFRCFSKQSAQQNGSTSTKIGSNLKELGTPLKALPLPASDYSTPNVVWQQNDSHVTLKIQTPSIEYYDVNLVRGRILTFKTSYQETEYKLNLNLFAKIDSWEHFNRGLYIMIKLKKLKEAEEWPRLILSKEKVRYISYNVTIIPVDDDSSDEEKPLPQEMIESSKILGREITKDAEKGSYVYEYGSDIDWRESDIESSSESDDD